MIVAGHRRGRIGPITDPGSPSTIDVVRGRLDPAQAAEVLALLAERDPAAASQDTSRLLSELVCVVRQEGALAGFSSVHAEDVALIGGRRFWIYRSVLADLAADRSPALIRATFNVLEAEFDRSAGVPIGLCVLVADAQERRRRPEAEWSDPRMIYAGYLADGRQVRIAYFDGADITLERPRA